jgi:DNA-directed RNA polymerase specialized sigma24 family protein
MEHACHGSERPAVSEGVVVEMSYKKAKRAGRKFLADSRLRDAAIRSGPDREGAWAEMVRKYGPRVAQAIRGTLIRLGTRPPDDIVEDLVEATWLRATQENYRVLRAWDPGKGESLGAFLAQMGVWEARTSRRLWARRKEIKLDEAELRRLADRPDSRPSPDGLAQIKEAAAEVRAWEAGLGLLERRVWEMRKEGASSRAIGIFLGRDHKTVTRVLLRLQKAFRRILEGREP